MKNLVVFLFICGPLPSALCDVIAPPSAAVGEGNTYQILLDTAPFPARFQQVYSSSLFGGFPQGVSIGQIVFRGDAVNGRDFASSVSDVEVHLSTTSKAVDSLSPVFDLNVGPDDMTVVGRTPIFLFGSGGHGGIEAWSILLDFRSNRFLYDPAAGNLLMDIKVFTGASTSPFDAVDSSGDTVSSVFAYGSSMPASGQPSSLGLATDIFFQSVPEPSTVALLVFGAVVMALGALKKIRQRA